MIFYIFTAEILMTREWGLDQTGQITNNGRCLVPSLLFWLGCLIHLVRAGTRINNINIDLPGTINRIRYWYCSSVGHQGGLVGVITSIINEREILHFSSGKKIFQLWQAGGILVWNMSEGWWWWWWWCYQMSQVCANNNLLNSSLFVEQRPSQSSSEDKREITGL